MQPPELPSEFVSWGPEIDFFWEDFAVGQRHRLGSHLVTAEEIIDFARRFDPQPFHVDPERARHSAFHGLVASGWHSAAIWMRLYFDGLLSRCASIGSPGVDEVAWLSPVRPGDELRGSLEVISTRPSRSRPDRGLIQARAELINQEGTVTLRMTPWGMFGRRPSAA